MKNKLILGTIFFVTPFVALAQQSCLDYPYDEGIDVQDVNGGTKILSTGQVSVSMDDIDSIKDAREEATIEAKALIAKFMTEDIKSDSKIDKVVNESKQSDGQNVQVNRKELATRVKSLRNSSQALLRGVVTLGSCYTKGREMRVTVGLKPETINSAEITAGTINRSLNNQSSPQSGVSSDRKSVQQQSNNPGVSQSLRGMDGYSNTSKLNQF